MQVKKVKTVAGLQTLLSSGHCDTLDLHEAHLGPSAPEARGSADHFLGAEGGFGEVPDVHVEQLDLMGSTIENCTVVLPANSQLQLRSSAPGGKLKNVTIQGAFCHGLSFTKGNVNKEPIHRLKGLFAKHQVA